MRPFRRAVTENAVAEELGRHAGREQHRHGDGEPVHQNDHPRPRRRARRADQHRDLVAAEFRQQLKGLAGRCASGASRAEQLDLARQAPIVQARAATHAVRERQPRQSVHQHRSGRSVADTHLAQDQRVAASAAPPRTKFATIWAVTSGG